eukprot:gene415-1811_t
MSFLPEGTLGHGAYAKDPPNHGTKIGAEMLLSYMETLGMAIPTAHPDLISSSCK